VRLSPDELRAIDQRIQRAGAANCWTGTSGSVAADARRLVRHIQETSVDDPYVDGGAEQEPTPVDHILRGERELRSIVDRVRPVDAGGLRPGSAQFLAVLDEIRELHLRKTLDYGQDDDALSNIRQSADVVNMPAWAGAVLRMADKMHRIKSFFRRGRVEFDGVDDTLLDIASYSVIALVLHRESRHAHRSAPDL